MEVCDIVQEAVIKTIPKKKKCKKQNDCLRRCLRQKALAKECSKLSKPGFSNTWTVNFQMFKLVLEKAEEPETKLPTSAGSSKKQVSCRKTSTSALLTVKDFDGVDHSKLWKILKETGIPDHLTCLLRNLSGQEATVRTGHGTTDWFQIGKGVCQGYILSPFI